MSKNVILNNKLWLMLTALSLVLGIWFMRTYFLGIPVDFNRDLENVNGKIERIDDTMNGYFISLVDMPNTIFYLNEGMGYCYDDIEKLNAGQKINMKVYFYEDNKEDGVIYELATSNHEILSIENSREFVKKDLNASLYCALFFLGSFLAMVIMGFKYMRG